MEIERIGRIDKALMRASWIARLTEVIESPLAIDTWRDWLARSMELQDGPAFALFGEGDDRIPITTVLNCVMIRSKTRWRARARSLRMVSGWLAEGHGLHDLLVDRVQDFAKMMRKYLLDNGRVP